MSFYSTEKNNAPLSPLNKTKKRFFMVNQQKKVAFPVEWTLFSRCLLKVSSYFLGLPFFAFK